MYCFLQNKPMPFTVTGCSLLYCFKSKFYLQLKKCTMSILTLDKLSKIYYQKFFRKIADDLNDVKHYLASTPQETKKLLTLFQLRNEGASRRKRYRQPKVYRNN